MSYRGSGSSRAKDAPGIAYGVCVLAVLFGLFWLGHGLLGFFGPEQHTAYFATPDCDESLLAAGKEHLAKTCSVVRGTVASVNLHEGKVAFETIAPKESRIRAFDAHLDSIFEESTSWLDATKGQPLFLQIYDERGGDQKEVYVVAKVLDPATQKIITTAHTPMTRNGQAWKDIRISLMIIGVPIALMLIASKIRG